MIYDGTKTEPIIMDASYGSHNERSYAQVRRAAEDLRCDIAMVTGAVDYKNVQRDFGDNKTVMMARSNHYGVPQFTTAVSPEAIIIGSIADSNYIKEIISNGKFPEAKSISGK